MQRFVAARSYRNNNANFVLPLISLLLSGNKNSLKSNFDIGLLVGPTLASQQCPSTGMPGFDRQLLAQRGPSNGSPALECRKFANTEPAQVC